jgi:hypothetical protein
VEDRSWFNNPYPEHLNGSGSWEYAGAASKVKSMVYEKDLIIVITLPDKGNKVRMLSVIVFS